MTSTAIETAAAGRPAFLAIAAASIGNALEWFDLLIYGYLAITLSQLFFPGSDETASLMLTFGTFGAAYLARPLGALVLGSYADKSGRKASLTLSILLMTIGTLVMALVPTYETIGIFAPVAVLGARLLQGFSIGGEFGGSTSFLVEHSASRKGFFASFQWSGQGLAAVLASLFGIALTTLLTPDELKAWGWRLPYLFGLLIAPVGIYIRRFAEETPEFIPAQKGAAPVRELLSRQWSGVLLAAGIVIVSTSANYLILYMPTYAIKQLSLPASSGFTATMLGGLILTFGSPVFGHWSDAAGRTRIMLAAAALFVISAYPAFLLVTAYPSLSILIAVVCWLSLLKTAYSGVLPSLMAELFPPRVRATGIALSYNLSVPVFGGFAPLVSTWLIAQTGSSLAPSFYLIVTAIVSFGALIAVQNRLRKG
jgi:MFS transporter, MHS family, proline/betaine transporter